MKEQTFIEQRNPLIMQIGFVPSGTAGFARPMLLVLAWLAATLLTLAMLGCELTPTKPDVVFSQYRDRMKAEKVTDARELLNDPSKALAEKLAGEYKLPQPPEDLAILNILDPVTAPTVVKVEDTYALIQARTLKGELRLVRMVRASASSPWKVDIVEELQALETFLSARQVLEMMREQAGEYAESWKAFDDQLTKMGPPEQPPPKSLQPKPSKPHQSEKPTTGRHGPKRSR